MTFIHQNAKFIIVSVVDLYLHDLVVIKLIIWASQVVFHAMYSKTMVVEKLYHLSVLHLYVFIYFYTRNDTLFVQSKKDSTDEESIQSSTTPVTGYQMGK